MIKLHVFPYSARPGTEAADMTGQVLSREITARARSLRALGAQMAAGNRRARVGQAAVVLLERQLKPGFWLGTTECYEKVRIAAQGRAGQMLSARISGFAGECLSANQEEGAWT